MEHGHTIEEIRDRIGTKPVQNYLGDFVYGRDAKLCRSFNRILCTKGEYLWETNQQQNLDRKSCVLH